MFNTTTMDDRVSDLTRCQARQGQMWLEIERCGARRSRETDLVARLGGDEFGLVLAQPRDMSAVDSTCARIIKSLNEPIDLADRVVVIGASIGVAKVCGDRATPDEIYKAADVAMYEAKKAGRNTWRWDESSAVSAALISSWKRSDMNETVDQSSDARENDRPTSRFHTG